MTTDESPCLTEATVQDIQLELIRRTQHNSFDGEQVHRDLLERRDWWEAVMLDGQHSLIKLRDLPGNDWNVDTLFILATDGSSAHRLAELAETWAADTVEVHGEEATQRELGSSYLEHQRLVSFWWD